MIKEQKLINEIMELSPSKKAEIIDKLLHSLDKPDKEIDEQWKKEVEDRIDAYEQGKIKSVSLDQVLRKYN
jgi:putative addiction module component (TIGR02574 family)